MMTITGIDCNWCWKLQIQKNNSDNALENEKIDLRFSIDKYVNRDGFENKFLLKKKYRLKNGWKSYN